MKAPNILLAAFIAALVGLLAASAVLWRSSAPASASAIERMVSPGPLSPAHKSLAADCQACHTPATGVEGKTCIACHSGTDFGSKQSTQFHRSAHECTGCHVEHTGTRPVAMNHQALLDPINWSASTKKASPPSSSPNTTLDCASCHRFRDPHRGVFGADCAACHSTSRWQIEGYRHPSVNSRECAQCHLAPPSHYMEHFRMVSQAAAHEKAKVDQCYACHTTDSFNNIRRKGWYDHH